MKKIICFTFFVFVALYASSQSGWTREKGGFYGKIGVFTLKGNEYYTPEGQKTIANTFHQTTLMAYGEYGITKNITAILNYPYYKFQGYKNFSTVSGIGDPQLEFKYALYKKIPVVSVAVGAELPFANQNNISIANTEMAPGIRETNNLPTGDGDFNQWATVALSGSLGNTPSWLTIWGQYNNRTKGFRDQRKIGFELGYKWTTRFWTNMRLNGVFTRDKSNSISNFINGDGAEYSTLLIGSAYEFVKNWSITFDYQTYSDFLARRKNVYSTPLYQIGISAKFRD
jgi:hypothetical protein